MDALQQSPNGHLLMRLFPLLIMDDMKMMYDIENSPHLSYFSSVKDIINDCL